MKILLSFALLAFTNVSFAKTFFCHSDDYKHMVTFSESREGEGIIVSYTAVTGFGQLHYHTPNVFFPGSTMSTEDNDFFLIHHNGNHDINVETRWFNRVHSFNGYLVRLKLDLRNIRSKRDQRRIIRHIKRTGYSADELNLVAYFSDVKIVCNASQFN